MKRTICLILILMLSGCSTATAPETEEHATAQITLPAGQTTLPALEVTTAPTELAMVTKTRQKFLDSYAETGELLLRTEIFYDEQNRQIAAEFLTADGSRAGQQTYLYFEDEGYVECMEQWSFPAAAFGTITRTYYNEDGKILKLERYLNDAMTYSMENTYDEKGNHCLSISNSDGTAQRTTREYDEKGNRISACVEQKPAGAGDASWATESRSVYQNTYDDQGRLSAVLERQDGLDLLYTTYSYADGSTVQTEEYCRDHLQYKAGDKIITITDFDEQGNVCREEVRQNGVTVEIVEYETYQAVLSDAEK